MHSKTIKQGNLVIQRFQIIGTSVLVHEAWEVDNGDHGTITHFDGVRYGKVGTKRITAELNAMKPGSIERYDAVHAYIEADKQRAYDAIVAAFPETVDGYRDMGAIETIVQS